MCKRFFSILIVLGILPGLCPAQSTSGLTDADKEKLKTATILISNTKLEKGTYLGVASSPASAALREQLKLKQGIGLVVDRVEKGSPAEQAGVKQYDILEKLDDQWLINSEQFATLVRMQPPGLEIKLSLIRQGQPLVITAKLIEKDVPPLGVNSNLIILDKGVTLPGQFMGAGHVIINGPNDMIVTKSDGKYSVSITRKGDNMEMSASDATGNVLFDGPIDTDDQWKTVPPDIEPIARKMAADMKTTKTLRGRVVP